MKKTLIISTFLLLTSTFGCMSLDPSTVIIKSFRHGPFDAIFVPGCPYTKPEYEGLLLARVYWAKYIWEQGMTKRILFSGSSVNHCWAILLSFKNIISIHRLAAQLIAVLAAPHAMPK